MRTHGNAWTVGVKGKQFQCKKGQGPLWNQIWFGNLRIPPNCFLGGEKNGFFSIQANAFLFYQRHKNTLYGAHSWSTKCYHHKSLHRRRSGDLETWWIFVDSSVWVIQFTFELSVVEAETVSPRTVVFGLRFKQSTRSALYLNQPQAPDCSLQFK